MLVVVGCYPEKFPAGAAGVSGGLANGGTSSKPSGLGGAGGVMGGVASGGDGGSVTSGFGGFGGFGGAGAVGGGTSNTAGGATAGMPECVPLQTHEPLPQRLAVMSEDVQAHRAPIFTRDLYNTFKTICGGCHVDTGLGDFGPVSFDNFPEWVTPEVQAVIRQDDPDLVMPPVEVGGMPFSERADNDAVRELADSLQEWDEAGRPADVFYREAEVDSNLSPFIMAPQVAQGLTNIGNCAPNRFLFASAKDAITELDEHFESLEALPRRLEETDLFSFDSNELARHGTLAFAPAYPLWSDGSGKLRHVRVPAGRSIHYDRELNEFEIPDNTRFYKTFLKKVVDSDGEQRFRKIETRLIVARQDECSEGASCRVRALMGSYRWNEAETEAILVEKPYRNGEPFADDVFRYVTDELEARAAQETSDFERLARATRGYAIPGLQRCIDCHMGSRSRTAILGFTPLQIQRRPFVEEDSLAYPDELVGDGVLEQDDPSSDELGQLQRLIDLGVVTGIEAAGEVPSLRESQDELPRTPEELIAQGYLLGNCAHCHNPRGFASVRNPVLTDKLDFFPQKGGGGIFGFPLHETDDNDQPLYEAGEAVAYASPRLRRGANRRPQAYITPSLFDLEGTAPLFGQWRPKIGSYNDGERNQSLPVLAPWRSLIYRNVDTPFTYADDLAIFPKMPMHTGGFDCRAPRIVGDWMVSIPARPDSKAWIPSGQEEPFDQTAPDRGVSLQPFFEVKPDDLEHDYDEALFLARERLERYRSGERYLYCPDTSDVVDPAVLADPAVLVPQDEGQVLSLDRTPLGFEPVKFQDNVPDRAHWVDSDFTAPPGEWAPRRLDWADVLVWDDPDEPPPYVQQLPADDPERRVVERLQFTHISESFADLALEPVPFGLWECEQSGAQTVEQVLASEQPLDFQRWLRLEGHDLTRPDTGVYLQSPGEAIFKMICANCHGPRGDGTGDLATKVLELSGGTTRVANLRDGLMDPSALSREFSPFLTSDPAECARDAANACRPPVRVDPRDAGSPILTPFQMGARYLVYMALGGTQRDLPKLVLDQVAMTPVFGRGRNVSAFTFTGSANMLNTAIELCMQVHTGKPGSDAKDFSPELGGFAKNQESQLALIMANGDMELWEKICAQHNPAPIKALTVTGGSTKRVLSQSENLYRQEPARTLFVDQPVGNQRAEVERGIQSDNWAPWCFLPPASQEDIAWVESRYRDPRSGDVPWCPPELRFSPKFVVTSPDAESDLERWARRGAMNAGFAVYAFLDAVRNDGLAPTLGPNQCE